MELSLLYQAHSWLPPYFQIYVSCLVFSFAHQPCLQVFEPETALAVASQRSANISSFANGRFWLVINEAGNMVTARQEPRLVLVSLTCEGDTLTLSAAYTPDLVLPIETPATNPVLKCR